MASRIARPVPTHSSRGRQRTGPAPRRGRTITNRDRHLTLPTSLVPDTETRSTLEALFDAVKAGRVEEVHAQLDRHPAWIDAFDPSEGCCRGTLLNVAVDRGA